MYAISLLHAESHPPVSTSAMEGAVKAGKYEYYAIIVSVGGSYALTNSCASIKYIICSLIAMVMLQHSQKN